MAPNYQPRYSPRFKVVVDGTKFQEPGGRIADLVVETTLEGADRFSFTLNYPFDPEHHDFSGLNWGQFEVGKSVDVSMGFGGDGSLTPLFMGTINSIRTEFDQDRGPSASVSGYGLLHATMKGTESRSWSKTKIDGVVKEVLGNYDQFSTVDVDRTGLKREKIIQHNESDYHFLRKLADKYGYRFYANRDEVHFKARSSMGAGSKVANLRYGDSLHQFSGELNESSEVSKVEVRHWDMKNEKEIVGTATATANNSKKEVFRVPCRSKKEAEKIAETKVTRLSKALARGEGEADGVPEIKAGETIELLDMGKRFSKNYYVTKATHRMGGSGYRTSFEVTEVPE